MSWIGAIVSALSGSEIVKQFTDPLLEAYQAKLAATNDTQKLEAEQAIVRLEAARDIALAEQHDRWSATRLGRWLIVVPFGLWWAAIFVIQFVNPWIVMPIAEWLGSDFRLTVLDVPAHIFDMAMILVPAIVIGDVGALVARRIRR